MRFIVPALVGLAGGLLGGFVLWHVVGLVGTLVVNHPSGVLLAPLVLVASFAGAAAWQAWRQHTN